MEEVVETCNLKAAAGMRMGNFSRQAEDLEHQVEVLERRQA